MLYSSMRGCCRCVGNGKNTNGQPFGGWNVGNDGVVRNCDLISTGVPVEHPIYECGVTTVNPGRTRCAAAIMDLESVSKSDDENTHRIERRVQTMRGHARAVIGLDASAKLAKCYSDIFTRHGSGRVKQVSCRRHVKSPLLWFDLQVYLISKPV